MNREDSRIRRRRLIEEAKRLLPAHVPVDPPETREQAQAQRAEHVERLRRIVEPLPAQAALDPCELATRSYRSHHEVKLTYMAEAGDAVPAYLLIPAEGSPPFPAVVAHHQCNLDCDLGKEAVVGKVVDRPDQAYALELVRRGFVVLAPDTKSCGERPAAGFRKLGECRPAEPNFKEHHCYWGAHIGRTLSTQSFAIKQAYDALRAVDYLMMRTDLVDSTRVGMIGHSQGAEITQLAMALDPRVRAGVCSCATLGGVSRRWLMPNDATPDVNGGCGFTSTRQWSRRGRCSGRTACGRRG